VLIAPHSLVAVSQDSAIGHRSGGAGSIRLPARSASRPNALGMSGIRVLAFRVNYRKERP